MNVVIWIGQARLARGGAARTGRLVVMVRQLASRYQLHEVRMRHLGTPVNDVFAVTSAEGEFALKLYHRIRTPKAVQWEIDLLMHLHSRGAPVVQPIRGRNGYLERLTVDGQQHVAVLFTWAPGSKPTPGYQTYGLLGEAAARIHRAADDFAPSAARETTMQRSWSTSNSSGCIGCSCRPVGGGKRSPWERPAARRSRFARHS